MSTSRMSNRPIRVLFAVGAALALFGCGSNGANSGGGTVEITRPAEGSIVAESRFKVRGTAEGVERVSVNGKKADVVGGKWNVLLEFSEGPATVEARGGGDVSSVEFTVDSVGPKLTVTAPERARYVSEGESTQVRVAGRASDSGTGLRAVSIDNGVVELDSNGKFEQTVELESGLDVLEVSAIDEAGNESVALRGVMHGAFADPTERIEPGVSLKIGPGAVDTAETVVENELTPRMATMLAKKRVDNQNFAIQRIDWKTLEVEVEPKSGKLDATVSVETLELEGDATVGGDTYPVVVTIDRASIVADVVPSVDANNEIDVAFENAELRLEKKDFHFALENDGDKKEVDSDALRNLAVTIAKNAFSNILANDIFDRLYDPSVLEREVELLGRTLVFEVVPIRFRLRVDGIYFDAAFEMPAKRHARVPEVPGALERELGNWNAANETAELNFRSNRTAADKIVHGVWRSGLLHQVVGREQLSSYDLPVELTAGALGVALDRRISDVASSDTPAAFRLRPKLPPVAAFQPAGDRSSPESGADAKPSRLQLRAGEFLIDVLLQTDGEPTEIATVAIFLDVDAGVALDGFELKLDIDAEARADLVAEPEIDFDDRELETTIAGVFEAVPSLIGDELTVRGKSELRWIEIQNPRWRVVGEEDDRISMFADVKAREE